MKHASILWLNIMLLFASCTRNAQEQFDFESSELMGDLVRRETLIEVPEGIPYTKEKLDAYVKEIYVNQGDFRWEQADFKMLWSALQYGDHALAIGYQPAGYTGIENSIHSINIQAGPWKEVHDALIELIQRELSIRGVDEDWRSILIEDDAVLPIITIRMTDRHVLTALRNLKNVRYLEPLDYSHADVQLEDRSTSGCSVSTYALNSADYSTTTPNAILPWNFTLMNIPTGWNLAQGQGITIGVIDAGISSSQSLLGGSFNNGDSNVGRSITTDFTLGNSAYTSCSHGTSMCGLAAGPRNALGATTGVAYKSNLHFIRAAQDVVLDQSSERTGLKNALIRMGNRADVRVVSMSIGTPFYSSVIEDGVNYAWGMGKMLMAAAGTSFSITAWWGVVYPAALTKCVAITGVKENFSTCASCHDGAEVDFTVTMERSNNSSRNTLSLNTSGYAAKYIGGSSCATAMASGIASMVWSVNPSFSREQVYNFLLTTSQYYPIPNGSRGFGNLNAGAAVSAAQAGV
jgi:subtilisin family serine protease